MIWLLVLSIFAIMFTSALNETLEENVKSGLGLFWLLVSALFSTAIRLLSKGYVLLFVLNHIFGLTFAFGTAVLLIFLWQCINNKRD